MTMTRYIILFLVFGCFYQVSASAQIPVDSLIQDSLQQIHNSETHLRDILEQQRLDSVKRRELEDLLISVKISESQERQKLLDEINLLESRDSILYARRKLTIDSLRQLNHGAPVVPFRDTVFTLYNGVGSYSVEDRAQTIGHRMQLLADNYAFHPDSVSLRQEGKSWFVEWQDQVILNIDEADAMWADKPIDDLAQQYLRLIQDSISEYREDNSLRKLMTGILFAALILLTVSLIIIGINKLIGWIRRKIISLRDKYLSGISIRGYQLISPHQQVKFLWTVLYFVKWFLILICVYLALPILLNLFPSTQGYAPILLGYFLNPLKEIAQAVIAYLPKLITVLVICFIFRYVFKALRFFANELKSGALTIPGFYKEWATPTFQILRALLFAFLLIIIFPYLPGADSPIFQGVSVFLGVLFTFGSAGALGNIVAGLLLTYMRPFTVGDRIKIGEVLGDVIEKNLLATRIRTVYNEVISIPNSQVMNSHTINYSIDIDETPLIVYTQVTMAYELPWQRVHELALKACAKVDLLEKDPAPIIMQRSLDDFYVTYQVNAFTRHPHQQAMIYSELHKHILDVFHEAGIELLSPHYQAMRDGNKADIPPKKPTPGQ